jgi:hypothetical protein
MRRARHVLLMLFAVIGLAVVAGVGVSRACPQVAASMPMMHHHHGQQQQAPASADGSFCVTCTAILPSLARFGPHLASPIALFDQAGVTLSGIDLGLDPPPPRIG